MVLTRQDAIVGWRNLMGPTDPDKAAEETPEKYVKHFYPMQKSYNNTEILSCHVFNPNFNIASSMPIPLISTRMLTSYRVSE